MTSKEYMISTLHKLYREDEWIQQLYGSIGAVLDGDIADQIQDDYDNLFFSTLSRTAIEVFEKDLGIVAGKGSTIEARRKTIQSRWLGKRFASLPVIQAICDIYYDGDVKATYDDATITYTVKNRVLPLADESKFLSDVDEIKPAHIGFIWKTFSVVWGSYCTPLLWQEEYPRKWTDLKTETWKQQKSGAKNWTYCLGRNWNEMKVKEVV